MRFTPALFRTALLAVALAASRSIAQQPDSHLPPQFSPISIDPPRAFPPASAIQARPIPANSPAQQPLLGNRQSSNHQSPNRQPPVDVRLIAAEEASASAAAKPPLRLAPRSTNGRTAVERPSAPTATSALVSVGGSLCAVVGVFLVVVWCTRRFAPPGASALPKEAVESLGRASLTARQQMQLIRVGNKLLLVALSPTGVEPLTEITDATEVEHLLALCRRGQKGSSSEIFRQTLAQLGEESAPGGFVGIATTKSRGGR